MTFSGDGGGQLKFGAGRGRESTGLGEFSRWAGGEQKAGGGGGGGVTPHSRENPDISLFNKNFSH